MKTMSFTNFAAAALLGISIGVPLSAPADDTEVYTGDNIAEGINPNVLFILDTSGSMNAFDGRTRDRLDRMKDALYGLLDNVDNVNIGLMRFTNPGGPILFPIAQVDADASLISQAGQPDVTVRISDNADDAEELLSYIGLPTGPARIGDVKLDSVYLDLMDSPAFGTEFPLLVQLGDSAEDAEQGTNARYSTTGNVLESVFDPGSSYGTETIGLNFQNVETTGGDTDGATVLFAQLTLTSTEDRSGALDLKIFGLFAGDMPRFPSSRSFPCPADIGSQDIYCRLGLTSSGDYGAGLEIGNVDKFLVGGGIGRITDKTVMWTNVPGSAANEELRSPDISPIIQEIFDHPNWQTGTGGNDLGIFYTGTTASRRSFYSYDNSSTRSAKLTGEYVRKGNPAGTQIVALRFQGVRIPQGAVIRSAKLELTPVGESDDAVTINIIGEKVADAAAFSAIVAGVPSTPALRLSSRRASRPTSATVPWTLTGADKWTHESPVQTPDISTVIKEIIDQPGGSGWCGGNDLVLFLEYASGATPSDRHVFAHDADPSLAATLKVDYDKTNFPAGTGCTVATVTRQVAANKDDAEETVSSGNVSTAGNTMEMINSGTSAQTNGVIFRNIEVHPGASTRILSAVVDFTAQSGAAANTTTVTVTGQDSDDIAQFESSVNDISARILTTPTSASQMFKIPAADVSANDSVVTADLSSIITEITTRPGWQSGNDIALIFTGNSGQVDLYTHDDDASKSARLKLEVQYKISEVTAVAPTVVSVRNRLKELISEFTHAGSTPIVDTLYEAALYFRAETVLYGAARGSGSFFGAANERNTRLSHPDSYERPPGTIHYPGGCNTDDSNLSSDACRRQLIENSPKYITPIDQSCQSNFIVLLTDGEANNNHSVSAIRSMTGTSGCGTTLSDGSTVAGGESCGVELVKFLNENDQAADVNGLNGVKTYTIGFHISTQFLKDLASEGGGQFYEAGSSTGLSEVFQDIISDVLSRATSFAAPSLSVNAFNRLEDRNEVYFSLFEPSPTARWDGNIKKFQLCKDSSDDCVTVSGAEVGDVLDARDPPLEAVGADGRILDTALSFWSTTPDGPKVLRGGAGADIINRGYAARRVLTFVDQASQTSTQPSGTVTFFPASRDLFESKNTLIDSGGDGILDNLTAADGDAAQRLAQTRELLGMGGATLSEIKDQIDWIRGKDVDGQYEDAKFGGDNRYAFGDPLHGNPLALTYGGTAADPIIKLLAGTNDGGIRLINSNSGEEEWIFYPPSMLPLQNDLRANASTGKRYGIDGSATPWIRDAGDSTGNKVGVIEPAKGDFIRIFMGQRRGGNQYWGLDISPSTEIATNEQAALDKVNPKLMWRIRGGTNEFPMLGDTWSRPFLTTMQVGTTTAGESVRKTVLIFAGGYEESTQDSGFQVAASKGNAIYVVDAETGERLFFVAGPGATARHLSTPVIGVEVANMLYPIPSDVSAFDADGDGSTDRLYVGDLGGQMWRVDFAPNRTATAGLTGIVGRLAAVSSSTADADKRKFFYPPSVIQVRGIGSESDDDYNLVSAVTGTRSNPLNLSVKDRFYAFRDFALNRFTDTDSNGLADGYRTIRGDLDGGPADTPPAASFGDLTDLTVVDDLDDLDNTLTPDGRTAFVQGDGYFIRLKTAIGEKGLAAPVTIAGKLFFTTYLPQGVVSASECALAEGRGQLYGIDAISGGAIFNWDNSDDSDSLTHNDRTYTLGAGIPSNPVPVFFPEKVMLMIGVGGGAKVVDPEITVPKGRTYWLQQQ